MTIKTRDDIRRVCQLWELAWSSFGSYELFLFGSRFTAPNAFCPSFVPLLYLGIELEGWPCDYAEVVLKYSDVQELLDASQSQPWLIAHKELDVG